MTIYSLDALLFQFGTSLLFHVQFNCYFLTCIQTSQEAGQVVWYSHLLKTFPQFVVIHTVKGFSIVNEADVFLKFSCFFYDPTDVGNLISSCSTFSKCSSYIWKFSIHVMLNPSLKDFEHYLASIWNELSCTVVWTFFGIAYVLNSSTGIPSPPLALFVVMLPKAHLTSHSRMPGSRWVTTPSWLSGSWRSLFFSVLLGILATSS